MSRGLLHSAHLEVGGPQVAYPGSCPQAAWNGRRDILQNNHGFLIRIIPSARRHHVSDLDIWHALDNYMRVYENQTEVAMFIGSARDGTILEIGVVLDEGDPRIIHAMRARAKYWV